MRVTTRQGAWLMEILRATPRGTKLDSKDESVVNLVGSVLPLIEAEAAKLDVERLAYALARAVPGYQRWMEYPARTAHSARQQADAMEAELLAHARAIAAEYARLAADALDEAIGG